MPTGASPAKPSVNLLLSGKFRLLALLPEERGGLGFSVLPNAIYRHREALGLDHWSLLVLLAVVSHGRTRSPDFCPAAISVLTKDTGISRATVERTLKRLVTDPGASIRFGKKSPRERGSGSGARRPPRSCSTPPATW